MYQLIPDTVGNKVSIVIDTIPSCPLPHKHRTDSRSDTGQPAALVVCDQSCDSNNWLVVIDISGLSPVTVIYRSPSLSHWRWSHHPPTRNPRWDQSQHTIPLQQRRDSLTTNNIRLLQLSHHPSIPSQAPSRESNTNDHRFVNFMLIRNSQAKVAAAIKSHNQPPSQLPTHLPTKHTNMHKHQLKER